MLIYLLIFCAQATLRQAHARLVAGYLRVGMMTKGDWSARSEMGICIKATSSGFSGTGENSPSGDLSDSLDTMCRLLGSKVVSDEVIVWKMLLILKSHRNNSCRSFRNDRSSQKVAFGTTSRPASPESQWDRPAS